MQLVCCHAICLYFNRRNKQGSSSDGNHEEAPSGNVDDDCEVRKGAKRLVNLNKNEMFYISV